MGVAGTPVGSDGFGSNAAVCRSGGTNFHITGSVAGDLCIAPEGTKNILFGTSASANTTTERMRIDSSGNLLVGTASQYSRTGHIVTNTSTATYGVVIQDTSQTTGLVQFLTSASVSVGNILLSGGNSVVYNTTSDYRLKTVIGAVTGAGERIDALKPIDYLWKEGSVPARGFLAHQFQEVYAGSVTGTKDAVDADGKPKYQAMQASTSEVIADLVAELQSLRARVAQLESKL
jgi:hypothetical protein